MRAIVRALARAVLLGSAADASAGRVIDQTVKGATEFQPPAGFAKKTFGEIMGR